MISLTCSSCGGKLELPDNLDVAHCIYCGAKILITESESHKDKSRIKSYLDICESAIKAKNYQEALNYCNKILEIDSKNFSAWANKAIATCWLTTTTNNRYEEAKSYLDKAEQIDPVNPRIVYSKKELAKSQANWLCTLGMNTYNTANNTYNSLKISIGRIRAGVETQKQYIQAGNYFLQATTYDSDNMIAWGMISLFINKYNWVPWSNEMKKKAQFYDALEKKKQELEKNKQEIENLPRYKEDLKIAEMDLSNAEAEKSGFLGGIKIKKAEQKVKQLRDYIEYLEKLKSFDIPQKEL